MSVSCLVLTSCRQPRELHVAPGCIFFTHKREHNHEAVQGDIKLVAPRQPALPFETFSTRNSFIHMAVPLVRAFMNNLASLITKLFIRWIIISFVNLFIISA